MKNISPRPNMLPLNALRAFEAAARLGSFSSAAAELCVSAAAIAQQIKLLEASTEMRLFDRHAQGVSLTDAGKSVMPDLSNAFDLLADTVQTLARNANPNKVKIAALPSIAQFWLSPRLPLLRQMFPGLQVSITTRNTPPNLRREPFDISLFLELPLENEQATYLMQDTIFPVCSPAVAARLKTYSDLSSETLLRDQTWADDWHIWSAKTGCDLRQEKTGPVFSLYGLAIEEAKNSAGVLMGHSILVEPLLKRQELVAPFKDSVVLSQKLCLRVSTRAEEEDVICQIVGALRGDH